MEWAMESHSKDYWSFWASWLHGEGLGNGIPYQEYGFSPFFSIHDRTTGASGGPLGCMGKGLGNGMGNGIP